METLNYILSIASGLIVCIPLVVKLVQYVTQAVKEKNWAIVIALVMKLMAEAEVKFEDGADRKEWVMGMVAASADSINYDIDEAVISELIDSLCAMSKKVNAPKA